MKVYVGTEDWGGCDKLSGLCHGYLFWVCNFGIQLVYSPSTFYRIKLHQAPFNFQNP